MVHLSRSVRSQCLVHTAVVFRKIRSLILFGRMRNIPLSLELAQKNWELLFLTVFLLTKEAFCITF